MSPMAVSRTHVLGCVVGCCKVVGGGFRVQMPESSTPTPALRDMMNGDITL